MPRRSSDGVEPKTCRDRVVELPDAREAGGERDLGERQRRRLDQHPRRLRALGAGQRERRRADSASTARWRCRSLYGERAGEPGDAPRSTTPSAISRIARADEVGARVPLRRAGHGIRAGSACTRGSPPAARRGRAVEARRSRGLGQTGAGQLGRQ